MVSKIGNMFFIIFSENQTLVRPLSELLKGLGKSKVIDVLQLLSNGDKTLSDTMHDLRISPSTASRALDTLISLGLVVKMKSREAEIYKITPLGRKVLKILKELEEVYQKGVSEEELFEKEAEEYLYRKQKRFEGDKNGVNS